MTLTELRRELDSLPTPAPTLIIPTNSANVLSQWFFVNFSREDWEWLGKETGWSNKKKGGVARK